MMESAIYRGRLQHRRFRPRRHEFSYPLFMAFLDVDRLPELMSVSPLAAYNRWSWASYHERDHFGDPARPLRARLADDAAAHGLRLPDGPVFLLTHLRYLGYVFNPVSFFYCYDRDASLRLVLAEVNNTFGESRNYWLSAADAAPFGRVRRYSAPKSLHVSPFMPMTLDYDFAIAEPGERLAVTMRTLDEVERAGGPPLFDATLTLTREPWSRATLHRALLRQPWMTASVIAAIHWEALKLYLKHVPVYTHPGRVAHGGDALASRRAPAAEAGGQR